VLVVDDASRDGSAAVAAAAGVRVVERSVRGGPAAARNLGASESRGEVLLFVDADVLVRPETVTRAASAFLRDDLPAAVFGSYDDEPSARGAVSQYKNLLHHFVHQHSEEAAETFWAGCGAVTREAFEAVGGFDAGAYPEPSVEDIELGYRLRERGYRILLLKDLQVKHLKRWGLSSLLLTDIFRRAVPWSRLILRRGAAHNDLNLRTRDRLSAAAAWLTLLCVACAPLAPALLYVTPLPPLALIYLNAELYRFFARRRGALFLAAAVPLHWLYLLYGSATFAVCWLLHALGRDGSPRVKLSGNSKS